MLIITKYAPTFYPERNTQEKRQMEKEKEKMTNLTSNIEIEERSHLSEVFLLFESVVTEEMWMGGARVKDHGNLRAPSREISRVGGWLTGGNLG